MLQCGRTRCLKRVRTRSTHMGFVVVLVRSGRVGSSQRARTHEHNKKKTNMLTHLLISLSRLLYPRLFTHFPASVPAWPSLLSHPTSSVRDTLAPPSYNPKSEHYFTEAAVETCRHERHPFSLSLLSPPPSPSPLYFRRSRALRIHFFQIDDVYYCSLFNRLD